MGVDAFERCFVNGSRWAFLYICERCSVKFSKQIIVDLSYEDLSGWSGLRSGTI